MNEKTILFCYLKDGDGLRSNSSAFSLVRTENDREHPGQYLPTSSAGWYSSLLSSLYQTSSALANSSNSNNNVANNNNNLDTDIVKTEAKTGVFNLHFGRHLSLPTRTISGPLRRLSGGKSCFAISENIYLDILL